MLFLSEKEDGIVFMPEVNTERKFQGTMKYLMNSPGRFVGIWISLLLNRTEYTVQWNTEQ